MRTSAIAVALCSIVACEQARAPQPTPTPSTAFTLAAKPSPVQTRPALAITPPEPLAPATRDATNHHTAQPGGLPEPPSLEPKQYAAWLRALPAPEQRRVNAHCRKHPTSFDTVCGGIGPLHIPYPPGIRARMPAPEDPHSLFASYEDWHGSLSASQLKFIDKHCPGGEEQPSSDLCGENTPLVIAFDNQPVAFATTAGTFAFAPGHAAAADWPTAATPWLALDRDGDGAITSGAELFGNDSTMPDGSHPANGFVALAALDANHDGRIDAADPAFASLVLWTDANGDRRSSPDELRPASSRLESISLTNQLVARCDARGNCEGERAAIRWRDADGATHDGTVVDVYLPSR